MIFPKSHYYQSGWFRKYCINFPVGHGSGVLSWADSALDAFSRRSFQSISVWWYLSIKSKLPIKRTTRFQLFIQFEPWNFSSKDYDNAFPLCKKDYELDHTLRIIEINKSSVIILKTTVPISKQFSTCCKRTHNSCLSLNNKLQSRRNIIQTNIKLIFLLTIEKFKLKVYTDDFLSSTNLLQLISSTTAQPFHIAPCHNCTMMPSDPTTVPLHSPKTPQNP